MVYDLQWTQEQKKNFYVNLRNLPASEQQFLIFHDDYLDNKTPESEHCATDEQNFKLFFNAFSRFSINDKPMRMMPSRGMMQVYLEAMCSDVPRPVFRLKLSPIDGLFKTSKANGRDLFQGCVLLPHLYPSRIHGIQAFLRYAGAELHDFYHQMRLSYIPLKERKMFYAFADRLLAYAGEKPFNNKFARALALQIIDMDFPFYDTLLQRVSAYINGKDYKRVEPEQRFCHTLDLCTKSAIGKLKIIKPTEEETDEFINTITDIFDWLDQTNISTNKDILFSILHFKEDESLKTHDFCKFIQRLAQKYIAARDAQIESAMSIQQNGF